MNSLIPQSHAFPPTGTSTTGMKVNEGAGREVPKSWANPQSFAGNVAAKDPNLSGLPYPWLAGILQTTASTPATLF
ncbi:hypothetical protein EN978_31610 [Mesorhizobium sp. M7A.F.Ca.US.001.04.1.1]|uniref:hypothetical protein n=1 Tax=unclassified Mesorhizobium TaxID=325217 RepID=UPI000FCB1D76|nr:MULTISPECIES: hypothetical protein [unclassified Mesorhizobium]RUY21424.1 hypothetical protein EN979_34395 [Mesorhizobium sp. M7A.F.Ca.US.001.04.2.1]RUY35666.1 hypothetical protein EN978_31610 [Mesorhizobium sp. M7A.F.Ca.US.001.04.1.1]